MRTRQEVARVLIKKLTGLGQRHRVFPTREKAHAQFILKILHLATERGLREVKHARGAVERTMRRDRNEVTKVAQFHNGI